MSHWGSPSPQGETIISGTSESQVFEVNWDLGMLGTRIVPTLQLLNQWSTRDDQSPRTIISKQSKQLH